MIRVILLLTITFVCSTANAKDYGRWLCDFCRNGPAPGQADMGEITVFLRSTDITDRWQPNDTITVCDGANCAVVVWQTTTWAPMGPTFKDSGRGYKNVSADRSLSDGTRYTLTYYAYNKTDTIWIPVIVKRAWVDVVPGSMSVVSTDLSIAYAPGFTSGFGWGGITTSTYWTDPATETYSPPVNRLTY